LWNLIEREDRKVAELKRQHKKRKEHNATSTWLGDRAGSTFGGKGKSESTRNTNKTSRASI
jgi:hypothetical protein